VTYWSNHLVTTSGTYFCNVTYWSNHLVTTSGTYFCNEMYWRNHLVTTADTCSGRVMYLSNHLVTNSSKCFGNTPYCSSAERNAVKMHVGWMEIRKHIKWLRQFWFRKVTAFWNVQCDTNISMFRRNVLHKNTDKYSEDEGGMFFHNVGEFLSNFTASRPRRQLST